MATHALNISAAATATVVAIDPQVSDNKIERGKIQKKCLCILMAEKVFKTIGMKLPFPLWVIQCGILLFMLLRANTQK